MNKFQMLSPSIGLSFLFLFGSIQTIIAQEQILPPLQACCSAIIVNDLDTSREWYSSILGFELANNFKNEEKGISIANLSHGTTQLELIEIAGSMAPDSLLKGTTRLQGIFKFGMRIEDFDLWATYLIESDPSLKEQIVTNPVTRKRMLVMRDPDGNRIQLFEE